MSNQALDCGASQLASNRIPKKIHQIWVGRRTPPLQLLQSWQTKHPDWQYFLWTDSNLPPLVNRVQYDAAVNQPNGQADILRYEVLYQHGGVYVDADALCLRPLDEHCFGECDLFAAYENEAVRPGMIATGIIGCAQQSDVMLELVKSIRQIPLNRIRDELAWQTVGPALFCEVIKRYKGNSVIKILPSRDFYPEHHTGASVERGDAYSTHLWGTTKNVYEHLCGPTTAIVTGVAIVKDEGVGLAKVLPSVGQYCDHIFLAVDERTTDDTVTVIERCPHPSVAFELVPWHDFAANRNLAIDKACRRFPDTQWLLIFDGHEEVCGIAPEELRCKLALQPAHVDGLPVALAIGDQTTYGVVRILRPQVRYTGPVHEYPVLRGVGPASGLKFVHHAEWTSPEAAQFRRGQRHDFYIDRMKPLAEQGNPRYVYHLTMAYHDIGAHREALAWADRYRGDYASERFACHAYGMKSAIALQEWERGLALARKEFFCRPDYFFLRAWLHFGAAQLEEAGLYYGMALVTPMPANPSHIGIRVTREFCEENLRRLTRCLAARESVARFEGP